MTFTWGRLAVFVLAFAACQASPSTPIPLSLDVGHSNHQGAWADPLPGTKALYGLYQRPLDVGRRDCLSNGSNYCFGNNVDFCPGCGNCCVDGKFCCGGGKQCCGSGCCPSDQTCSEGKCLPPVVAVTVTSTILQTITRIATQRATIVIAEIVTSTAISTILVTISTAATQTDVVWATVTAVAKREAPSADLPQPSGRENALLTPSLAGGRASRPSEPVKKGLSKVLRDAPIPRQADVPTVTNYVTQTTDVTSISSTIITTHTTSTGVTTVYQTSTRVLEAETTITITSTLTLTSRPPSTITLTTTASLIPPTTPTPNPSTPPQPAETTPPAHPLPTPAIAGIATGSSVLALLLAGFILLSIRRRRRARSALAPPPPGPSFNSYHHHNQYRPNTSPHDADADAEEMLYGSRSSRSSNSTRPPRSPHNKRKPTLPRILPHFASSEPPAHHAAEFRLPASPSAAVTPQHEYNRYGYGHGHGGGVAVAAGGNQHQHQHQNQNQTYHTRNSSGLTTLVGTPSPTAATAAAAVGGGYGYGYDGYGFGAGVGAGVGGKEEQKKQQQQQLEAQGGRPGSPASQGRVWWAAEVDGSLAPVSRPASAPPGRGAGGGARQRAVSSLPSPSGVAMSSGSPRGLGRGVQTSPIHNTGQTHTSPRDAAAELEGDRAVGELEGDGGWRR